MIEIYNLMQSAENLKEISEESDRVYPFMHKFEEMPASDNSYIRTRGIVLIACNAKWDKDNKIDEIIDSYLKHITDSSPITTRQCIKCLPAIARCKPDLRRDIFRALEKADVAVYHESMRDLVWKDIRKALNEIQRLGGEGLLL